MSSASLLVGLLMAGLISIILLIFIFAIFGKLIIIQFQRWRLAKKGFVEIEHISETNIRRYFIMRPKSGKFDLLDGFYFYLPEALTKGGDVLKKYSEDFLVDLKNDDSSFRSWMKDFFKVSDLSKISDNDLLAFRKQYLAEVKQLREMFDVINKLNFKNEALSWKFGMPMITYYGDNPEPFVFRDKAKTFGSGVIKDAYLRLLMTQRFKDFQLFLVVGLVSLAIIAFALIGLYYMQAGLQQNLAVCQQSLNTSLTGLKSCLDANLPIFQQNSTIII